MKPNVYFVKTAFISSLIALLCFSTAHAEISIYASYRNAIIDSQLEKLVNKQIQVFGMEVHSQFMRDPPSPPVMEPLAGVRRPFEIDYQLRVWRDMRASDATFAIKFEGGKVYYKPVFGPGEYQPLTTEQGREFIFLVQNDGQMVGTYSQGWEINHVSLIYDEWPIWAGNMETNEGIVTSMTNNSGHFMAPADRDVIINRLLDNGNIDYYRVTSAERRVPRRVPLDPITYESQGIMDNLRDLCESDSSDDDVEPL